jgi:hypothetical protein
MCIRANFFAFQQKLSIIKKLLIDALKNAENIKKIALIFFVILGSGHIISALMIGNSYFLPQSAFMNRILTIPFALSSLVYAWTGMQNDSGKNKIIHTIAIIIALLIFLALVFIHFFIPDKNL